MRAPLSFSENIMTMPGEENFYENRIKRTSRLSPSEKKKKKLIIKLGGL